MYLQNENLIWVGSSDKKAVIVPRMANRHGIISGATGTGKTVTLKVLAESFSEMGVPVFLADVKGDVTSMLNAGDMEVIKGRLDKLSITDFECKRFPVRFWDVFGEKGVSLRTTISEMGPDLLSRLMELTDAQSGVMTIAFKAADDMDLPMYNLADLKAMMNHISEHSDEMRARYGNVSPQSVGAIMREILQLEEAGGDIFFGETAIDINDWFKSDLNGRGVINILESARLVQSPLLYSTFLLWMLSELYETLPEAGDLEKPKIVFFFDEAHMLFDDAPKALIRKVEQVVRLIRSKGVGVYFITQKPGDVPDNVLAQLGNKIQHALRAYTPNELKAVKAAAEGFRANPAFNTEETIQQLGTGEALVSFLDDEGIPGICEKVTILPPQTSLKAASDEEVCAAVNADDYQVKYKEAKDSVSAYEILTEKANALAAEAAEAKAKEEEEKRAAAEAKKAEAEAKAAQREEEKRAREEAREAEKAAKEAEAKAANSFGGSLKEMVFGSSSGGRKSSSVATRTTRKVVNKLENEVAKQVTRGILGTIKKL